ncbi:FtsX-like permease family protein [filamentous cyanobacterium LEGE 11480]|uniref:FtsX-like permease family protein n=2 Tax=Romeriopsis TaxID=2992131 RepID=A0A928VT77_9CYAN|nr:FtsX-like permease family protein [Romeriopsis navalis LEGE 11480]
MAKVVSNRPLWRLGWQRLRQRPLQYVLCVVGIALGVAMMVSIDLANGSAQRAFGLSTDAITGKATHRVVAVSPMGVEEAVYTKLKRQVGQVKSAPVVEGYVKVPELGNQPMRLVGVDVFAEAPFRSYFADATSTKSAEPQTNGNGFIEFLTQPNTVVLPKNTAAEYGVSLGETISVDLAGQIQPVQVVGIVEPGDQLNRRALSNFVFADIATAQELLDEVGRLNEIDLIVDNEVDLVRVKGLLPQGVVVETAESQKNAVQQMTAAFELNLTALSLLALVVGMFLIYNTVTFSVIQRRSMFGVLRCLGVTQGQIFILILAEAGIFSVVGSLIGIALGVVLGRSIVGLITQTINDFYFVVNVRQISLSNFTLVKGMVVGISSALIASAVPAWEAMRTAPSMILQRSSLENKVLALLPKLVLVWMGLTAGGIALLRWSSGGLVASFTGLFAVLLGAALLVPPLAAGLMQIVGPLGGQTIGVLGKLAPRDILRSLSRTSVAIAALMVSVSVIIGVSVMVGSFRGTVVSWLDQTLQADIYVSPPTTTANRVLGKVDPAIVEDLRHFPGVAKAVTYNDAEVQVIDYNKSVKLISADGDVSRGERPYRWIRPDLKPDPWDALDRGEGAIISEALYLREGTEEPKTVTLQTPKGNQTFPVIAVFYDYSSDRGTVILDDDLYKQFWKDDRIASLGLFAESGVDVDDLVQQIKTTFNERQSLSVQSNVNLRQGSLEIFDRTFAITDALRLLAVVVAFIGVLSTLMSLQLEKQREIGILRSTGMTPNQLTSLTLLETGLMGLMAGVFAMPLGYGLAWILIYVINVRSFGWTLNMVLKGQYFWQALVVSVCAALLAGIYPALRLGKMNVSEAIRGE